MTDLTCPFCVLWSWEVYRIQQHFLCWCYSRFASWNLHWKRNL